MDKRVIKKVSYDIENFIASDSKYLSQKTKQFICTILSIIAKFLYWLKPVF